MVDGGHHKLGSEGCGLQFAVMYSVLETLTIWPRCFAADAVLVIWVCVRAIVVGEVQVIKYLGWIRFERRGCVSTPESRSDVAFLIR